MNKNILIFSNGSINFYYESSTNYKKIKIVEKEDHNNFFLFKKKTFKFKKVYNTSKHKNKYFIK